MTASSPTEALEGGRSGPWPVLTAGAGLLLLWATFILAAGHGFDPTDEAYYLTLINDPSRYLGLSDFAALWSPLNSLVNGDIIGLRLAGAAILQACALLFGLCVARFAGLTRRPTQRTMAAGVALAIAAGAIWPFAYWKLTPNYNTAALAGLLLVFSGLMAATASPGAEEAPRPVTAAALLTGLGLGLCALGKPSTAAAALGLCLIWLLLLRPRRPAMAAAVSAVACIATIGLAIWLMGDGFSAYFEHKLLALRELSELKTDSGLSGRLTTALVRPVARENWAKIAAIAPFLAGLLALAVGWCWPIITDRRDGLARAISLAGALLLGLCAFWWRAADSWGAERSPGYLAWCFVTLAPLMVAALFFAVRGRRSVETGRRLGMAALLLAVAPVAYAFGTDVVIPFHAAGAAIFWPAALAVLLGEASSLKGETMGPSLIALGLATALGLTAGVAASPGPAGPHLWLQTRPTAIGPTGAIVALDVETSAYYRTLRDAAVSNGFRPGTPVADFAGLNDGMVYVIGGRPLALPSVSAAAVANRQSPWVLASPTPGQFATSADLAGARFPQDYQLAGRVVHRRKGWTEELWKPKNR